MKYITLTLAILIASSVIGCGGSKAYHKKHRTMEHKQAETNAYKELNSKVNKQ